jgi:hypothetical protein
VTGAFLFGNSTTVRRDRRVMTTGIEITWGEDLRESLVLLTGDG